MTGRKLTDDDSNISNKRLCTEVKDENVEKNCNSVSGENTETNHNNVSGEKPCVDSKNENTNTNNADRVKKRHVAMLLAYCGTNYWGMQKNPNFRTVESEVLTALEKANFIPSKALDEVQLLHFQRAARTDKGVSAAKQVVSFNIAHNYNVESINEYLPEDIRVLSIKRVTKGFNCKNDCVARTYSYTLPTFALAPEFHKEYPQNFRISEDLIQKTNEVLETFLGTHPFHNFTSKKGSKDPSAKRYIMSFKAEKPFVDGEEFITLTVKGQSFMLHQIRKMVGYTIAVLKNLIPENIKTDVWKEQKFSVPMAPGLGLVLENLHYDRYNRKFGNDGLHESLTWDEVAEEIENFKKKHILPVIIKKEIEEKLMFNWLQVLHFHRYEYSEEKDIQEIKSEESVVDEIINEPILNSQITA